MEKKALRKKYLTLRKQLSQEEVEEQSLAIANKALQAPIWEETNYHIFLSISSKKEVNTEYLLHILQGKDKTVIIPKAHFSSVEMTHILLQENTVLKLSEYHIPEPTAGIEVLPKQMDVVFVPLLAYDLKGNRIGYGKGFYDRFLAQCPKNCLKVGLSFFSPEPKILYENMDIPLDYCITPQEIHSF